MAEQPIQKLKTKAKRRATSDRHYIDDVAFHAALTAYKQAVADAEAKNLPKPIVPDYIATCLMMLARKYARKPGFSRYPFVEDMIGDAIMCCFKNLKKFDPKHPTAFPYFTMVVHNAFVQRILKEKTALYKKFRAIMDRQKELCGTPGAEEAQIYGNRYTDLQMREYCEKFEKRLAEKRKKSKDRKMALAAVSKISFDEDDLKELDLE